MMWKIVSNWGWTFQYWNCYHTPHETIAWTIKTTKANPIKLTSNDTKNKVKNMTTDRTISKIISREQQTDERYLQPKTHNKHVKPKQESKHSNNVSKVIKKE